MKNWIKIKNQRINLNQVAGYGILETPTKIWITFQLNSNGLDEELAMIYIVMPTIKEAEKIIKIVDEITTPLVLE